MAGFTGRERPVTITAHAEAWLDYLNPPPPFPRGLQSGYPQGWDSFALTVDVAHDVTYAFSPAFGDPGPVTQTTTFRTKVTVTTTAGGSWTDTLLSAGEVEVIVIPAGYNWSLWNDEYGDGSIALVSGACTADLTASFTLKEWFVGPGNNPSNVLVEFYGGPVAVGITATGQMTVLWGEAMIACPPLSTGTSSASHTGSLTSQVGGYEHQLQFSGNRGLVTAGFQASGPGFSYSDHSVAGTFGQGTLTGSTTSATWEFVRTGAKPFGSATVRGAPDWGYSLRFNLYDYETGDELSPWSTVNHYYAALPGQAGAQLIGSTSTGAATAYRFPPSGYRRKKVGELVDYDATGHTVNSDLAIHNASLTGTPLPSGAAISYFCLDEGWADTYGILLDSSTYTGNNKVYQFKISPPFAIATLRFAAAKKYRVFDAASRWGVSAIFVSSVADDTGAGVPHAVKFTNTALFEVGYQALTTTAAAYRLKPFFYRYHRIRVKASVAGAQFRLKLTYTEPLLIATPKNNILVWNFTVAAADTWETKTFDLAFPDAAENADGMLFPYVPMSRYAPGGTTGMHLYQNFQGSLWVDYLEGYHQPESGTEDRIPILFCGPLQESAADSARLTYDTPTNAGGQGDIGGINYARIFANGIHGVDLGTIGGLDGHWSQIKSLLDDATSDNDTGAHIVITTPPSVGVISSPTNSYALQESAFPHGATWVDYPRDTDRQVICVSRCIICGYYGMGDPTVGGSPTGGYDPLMILSGDKVINGEALGVVWKGHGTMAGAAVALHDNDTGTLLESDTTNQDGFYRLFHKYGVVKTYRNTPPQDTPAIRQTHSGTYPAITYTTLGLRFNSYWLKGNITPVDGSGYVLDGANRYAVVITDRHPWIYDWGGVVPPGGGLELAQAAVPIMFRAHRQESRIVVERSLNAGVTWSDASGSGTGALPGAPGGVAGNAADDASAALCLDRWDTLFLWYHDAGNEALCYASDDYGNSWHVGPDHDTPGASVNTRHPRAVAGSDGRHYVAAYDSGADNELKVWMFPDGWGTGTEMDGFGDAKDAPFAFYEDRHGILHLWYADTADDLIHRWYPDPSNLSGSGWSNAGATGILDQVHAGGDDGLRAGLIVGFTAAGALRIYETNVEETAIPGETLPLPAGTYDAAARPGVLVAPSGPFGDDYYLYLQESDGDRVIRWTRDGVTWAEPT